MFYFYLALFLALFIIGLIGINSNMSNDKKGNLLIILVCVELLLLSISLISILASLYLDDFIGQIFSIFILTVAAAESAVGLGIFIQYYRVKGNISLSFTRLLRG